MNFHSPSPTPSIDEPPVEVEAQTPLFAPRHQHSPPHTAQRCQGWGKPFIIQYSHHFPLS